MSGPLPSAEALYEGAPCGLLLTDGDGLILRANATVCGWLGYTAGELVGARRVQDLLAVGARLFHHTHCQPMLRAHGSIAEIQLELAGRDGRRLPMLISIMRRPGPPIYDEWALFLATERRSYERELLMARRAAEEALEARKEAENRLLALNAELSAADRRKNEFFATLSHELRNPLAPLRTGLEVLKLRFGHDRSTEPILASFDRQLHQLTHLMDDLMDMTRINQGRLTLRRAQVDLNALLRGAAQDVAEMMRKARHGFSIELPDTPLTVDADATRLNQVVVNLLTNAAKYTPDGGSISLRAAAEDGEAVIKVRDNGIGMPPEALPTVFNMFSQLEPALERAKGGLGIGLALVRGIVELHGGSVRADSEGEGAGSEFTVRLPLVQAISGGAPQEPAQLPQSGKKIMVIDDNVDAADMLVMALELWGCEVKAAHCGRDAIELARSFEPDIALLDIGLPDMNGYELARALRALPGGERMRLVAATGWGQDKDRQLAYEAGFDHHLTKPVHFEQLRALLT